MEKRDAELFQVSLTTLTTSTTPTTSSTSPFSSTIDRNIVELESRRQLRYNVHEVIDLTLNSDLTTDELRHILQHGITTFGKTFLSQLVRSLQCDDAQQREAVVFLLTVLNDATTHTPLQKMAQNESLSRAIRLSAALALCGMGVQRGSSSNDRQRVRPPRLYAVR